MIAGIHISQEIFEINSVCKLTVLKPVLRTRSQAYCAIVTAIWRRGLTEIKLRLKTSPAFFLFLSAYSYRFIKKINLTISHLQYSINNWTSV